MSNLEEDSSASGVNGLGNDLPPIHLLPRVDAGSIWIALTLLAYRGSLSDDEPSGGLAAHSIPHSKLWGYFRLQHAFW